MPASMHHLHMANDDDATSQRRAHLERMLEEFRAAQKRRLVKKGIALWNRTAAQMALGNEPPSSKKLN